MSNINELILLELLKNGRASERELAKRLRVSNSLINYRIRRMKSFGIIKSFKVYIDPRIFNLEKTLSHNCYNYSLRIFLSNLGEICESFYGKELRKINGIFMKIINLLTIDPRLSINKLCNRVGVSCDKVVGIVNELISQGLVKVLPIIDLEKVNFVMSLSFYNGKELKSYKIMEINAGNEIAYLYFIPKEFFNDNMYKIKKYDINEYYLYNLFNYL
jgi:DNA-binding Lrp family transcriptional regulator